MKKIRVGVIGVGGIAQFGHITAYQKEPDVELIAAADPNIEKLEYVAGKFSIPRTFPLWEDMLKLNLDAVSICSPNVFHAPQSIAALNAGINVLCEKPLCRSVNEVDRLIAASKKAKKILAVYQQSLLAAYFLKIREVIDSGVLGRIVQISIDFNGFSRRWDWQTMQSYNGGSLMNTGPHPLGQALALFGKGMPEIRCFMDRANTYGNAEDHVKLILSGKGHPLVDIEISSCCPYSAPTYVIYGTRGGMKSTTREAEWKYFIPEENPKQKLTSTPLRNSEGLPIYPNETLKWHVKKWPAGAANEGKTGYSPSTAAASSMTANFYAMLYKTLTTGAPLKITPVMVRPQMAVIEECRRQNPQIYRKRS